MHAPMLGRESDPLLAHRDELHSPTHRDIEADVHTNNSHYYQLPINHHHRSHSHHDITAPAPPKSHSRASTTWSVLLWSAISWSIYLFNVATFTYAFYLAVTHRGDPCEFPLAKLMGVIGTAGLVWMLVIPQQVLLEERASPRWETCCFRLTWLLRLLVFLTLLTSTVIGSLWTFAEMDHTSHVCPSALYNFSYYFLIVWWVFCAISGIIATIVVCVMMAAFMR